MRPTGPLAGLGALALAWALGGGAPVSGEEPGAAVEGPAKVISGDLIEVQGTRLRLYGVDAPETGQICALGDKTYDCGRIAATALMDLTAGVSVRCDERGREGDLLLATCTAEGYDLAEGMAYTGWALALPGTGERYRALETGAREARRGLWRGRFVPPWEWRAGKRLAPAEPDAGG